MHLSRVMRHTSRYRLALLAAILVGCAPGTYKAAESLDPTVVAGIGNFPPLWGFPAGIDGQVTVNPYEFRARDITAAEREMLRVAQTALNQRESGRAVAQTTWSIGSSGWQAIQSTTALCSPRNPIVKVELKFGMPRWTDLAESDPRSIREWIRVRAALDRHEAGHAAFAVASGLTLLRRIPMLTEPCNDLANRVRALQTSIVADSKASHVAYDRASRAQVAPIGRAQVSECAFGAGNGAPIRPVSAFKISIDLPEGFRSVRSAPLDPFLLTWSDGAGRSVALDFHVSGAPEVRLKLLEPTFCAGIIAGHPAEGVRGHTLEGDYVFVTRWLDLGGHPNEPAGNGVSIVGRARTVAEREDLMRYSLTIRRER
jgi:hypothetical protein